MRRLRLTTAAWLLAGCAARQAPEARPEPPADTRYRIGLCSQAPVRLAGPPGAQQSGGCVVRFVQELTDPATIRSLGATRVNRRYLVYVPPRLPAAAAPVVFVFPGYAASAEAAAFYYTHTRFERLADRDGFIVVYGNGLPNRPPTGEAPAMQEGGFFQGCLAEHAGEGVDVAYVRQILDQLATALPIDRGRVYATGLSAGG